MKLSLCNKIYIKFLTKLMLSFLLEFEYFSYLVYFGYCMILGWQQV